jgi:hypothetical protein
MGLSMPLADELGSRPEAGNATACDVAVPLQGFGEVSNSATGGSAQAAEGLLLDLPGDSEQEELACDLPGRIAAIEPPPLRAESGMIHLFERLKLSCDVVGTAGSA